LLDTVSVNRAGKRIIYFNCCSKLFILKNYGYLILTRGTQRAERGSYCYNKHNFQGWGRDYCTKEIKLIPYLEGLNDKLAAIPLQFGQGEIHSSRISEKGGTLCNVML
jgi:hypothetical protein